MNYLPPRIKHLENSPGNCWYIQMLKFHKVAQITPVDIRQIAASIDIEFHTIFGIITQYLIVRTSLR